MPSSVTVESVERRFEESYEYLGMNVLRIAAWGSRVIGGGDDSDDEPTPPFGPAGAVPYVVEGEGQFLVIYRRQYYKDEGGVDVTAAASFAIPDDLPLAQKRFKALRKRLALGTCARIASPYMSAVASDAIAMLTSVPAAPPWPEHFTVIDGEDLADGIEDDGAVTGELEA